MGCLHACAHDAAMCVRRGGRPRREKEEGKEGYIEWRMEKRALEEEKGKDPSFSPLLLCTRISLGSHYWISSRRKGKGEKEGNRNEISSVCVCVQDDKEEEEGVEGES